VPYRSPVQIRVNTVTLALAETFTIARGSSDFEDVVQVVLEHDGITAHGEGAPVDYWGESAETMQAFLAEHAAAAIGEDPFDLDGIEARLASHAGNTGAKMALDGALHDYLGKRLGVPVHRLLGVTQRTMPPTSYTIGIDTVDGTRDRTRRATGYEVLKVKVGGADDVARLEVISEHTDARLRIDGNEGWTIETARELMPELVRMGVEFVEEPFPAADLDAYRALRELKSRIPVVIDEGCKDLASVARIATYADGINIKLSKCRGIREAVRMTHAARALGLRVMLGCMIESELGIAQAAQVAPLVDYVDLDGHLLIKDGPFTGLGFAAGRLVLSDQPGLGVRPA
jgi:L-alanine-DL-glutamate epimerase-like enolase superfamily enzyme